MTIDGSASQIGGNMDVYSASKGSKSLIPSTVGEKIPGAPRAGAYQIGGYMEVRSDAP